MKRGISLISLVIVIIVMVIIAGIIVVSGFSSIQTTKINTFALEILNIQDSVSDYYFRYEKYPLARDYTLNISNIESESLYQFDEETIIDNVMSFKVVDLSLLGINDTEFGKDEGNDVYVLSEKTGKVYYINGIEYDGTVYYTLTDELYLVTNTNVTNNTQITSKNVKVYDVVFTPNTTNYTNEPIVVGIKIPKEATINSIVATGGKTVSDETIEGAYKFFTVNETSEDKTGNYAIEVKYAYNQIEKTASYIVENYDAVKPKLSIKTEFMNGARMVTVSATDEYSGVRSIKYVESEVEDDTYFRKYAKVISGDKFTINEANGYTIYVEDNAGNYIKETCMAVPETWKESVKAIYDGVPIPKGFMPSQATGENTKQGGLVIYEGTEPVTDSNVYNALRNRNQYVWVPVDRNNFTTSFIRKNFGLSNYIASKLGEVEQGTSYGNWEVELNNENMPLTSQDINYMTPNTLAEVQAMYASVKKYGGFYVARYEAGLDNYRTELGDVTKLPKGTAVHSRMNTYPYNNIPWTLNAKQSEDTNGAVEVARSVYTKDDVNYGVVSTLIYGVQWDTILQWWLDTGAVTSLIDSGSYGNYGDFKITAGTATNLINEGSKYYVYSSSTVSYNPITASYIKNAPHLYTTGALKVAKVNNIYDMAGNIQEYTMEGHSPWTRADRGGTCIHYVSEGWCVVSRNGRGPDSWFKTIGFRVALYIK